MISAKEVVAGLITLYLLYATIVNGVICYEVIRRAKKLKEVATDGQVPLR